MPLSDIGFYDTFVARDACGNPLRPYFPYVKDPVSIEKMRRQEVLEMGACWNGMVAFRGDLVAYRSESAPATTYGERIESVVISDGMAPKIQKRGWQMVDNGTPFSPTCCVLS